MFSFLKHPAGSLRRKVMRVVLISTASALLVADVALLTHDLNNYRQNWAEGLATEASIVALSVAPAMAFDDHNAAMRNLSSLQAHDAISSAALYTPDGKLFVDYTKPGEKASPASLTGMHRLKNISGEYIVVVQPIMQQGEWLGTVYMRAHYDITGRIHAYLGIFALVAVIAMAVALMLSATLQRVITDPLDAISDVAQQIIQHRDYSPRAWKNRDDEFGVVVEAFNRMLDEVQLRTQSLEQTNLALKNEVAIRHAAETALELANVRLESTMAAAEIGSWVWDPGTQQYICDRNLAKLYGFDGTEEVRGGVDFFLQYIHPDDLPGVLRRYAAPVEGTSHSSEFRIVGRDGIVRHVLTRSMVHLDETGNPRLMSGLIIDVTAQKIAEQALRKSEALYRAIGESINYGVWVCNADGTNIYVSESFLQLTGMTLQESSYYGWIKAVHPDDAEPMLAAWRECVRTGGHWYREYRVLGKDGYYHPLLVQGVPTRDDNGNITGWAGINLDISPLKKTEAALREADRRKDEFLATLAHELRNPLGPISHAVTILTAPQVTTSQQQWAREVITRQMKHMTLLLDDLLDVSRITRGRLELKTQDVSLESLVHTAVETSKPLINSKRHTLTTVLPSQPTMLHVDPLRLGQAITNLLTNAAKYTDAGGEIALEVVISEDELTIAVKDNGIGMSASAIPNMFKMFSQVESALDRSEGGLGIGLALVKGMVLLHGGRIEASSPGPGLGSCFVIHLPISCVVTTPTTELPVAPAITTKMSPAKILVVDDNLDAAQCLASILELSGHNVTVARNGQQAIEIAASERPNILILDIGMPEMNGYEVAQHIRQQPWGQPMILVAVSGWGQGDDKDRAKAAGFDQHFTKPVNSDELEQWLAGFRAISDNSPAQDIAAESV